MSDNNEDKPVELSSVVSLDQFRKNRLTGVPETGARKEWPQTTTIENVIITKAEGEEEDPLERTILLSLTDGDVVVKGYLGLTNTFLAIGDKGGKIKFAAAPGKWDYACDITDNTIALRKEDIIGEENQKDPTPAA